MLGSVEVAFGIVDTATAGSLASYYREPSSPIWSTNESSYSVSAKAWVGVVGIFHAGYLRCSNVLASLHIYERSQPHPLPAFGNLERDFVLDADGLALATLGVHALLIGEPIGTQKRGAPAQAPLLLNETKGQSLCLILCLIAGCCRGRSAWCPSTHAWRAGTSREARRPSGPIRRTRRSPRGPRCSQCAPCPRARWGRCTPR